MHRSRRLLVIGVGITIAACGAFSGKDGDSSSGSDAGVVDSGDTDAAPEDGGAVRDGGSVSAPRIGTATAIAVGNAHACAVTQLGAVYCWGSNGSGQLGNGSTASGPQTPQLVFGLDAGIVAVAAGSDQSCALTVDGGVSCWGGNTFGEVASSFGSATLIPSVVNLPGPATEIAAGGANVCALIGGNVYCWGNNTFRQCGYDDAGKTSSIPSRIPGLPDGGVIHITINGNTGGAASSHGCALTTSGGAFCWGDRANGALGDNSVDGSTSAAVPVTGLSTSVAAISAGQFHTCAITTSGIGMCWGTNGTGMLGNGSLSGQQWVPGQVSGLIGATAVCADDYDTCAIVGTGDESSVTCWGKNSFGELGTGDLKQGNTGQAGSVVRIDGGVKAIASTLSTTCAITTHGGVRCWGKNDIGEVGNGAAINAQDGGVALPATVIGFP